MDGNIIWIGENYIAGLSETFGARLHRHPVIEIYAACDGDSHVQTEHGMVQGEIIVIGPDTEHAIDDTGKMGLALFLDPLTEFGYSLRQHLLGLCPSCILSADGILKAQMRMLQSMPTEEHLKSVSENLACTVQSSPIERPFDEPVLQAIHLLSDKDCEYEMETLAKQVFLSKSRLAHIFSEQTGITLKEYLQYKRLENACRKMLQGMNITDAAYDTGFSGSSHIAVSSIKLTGMQLRKMLNL